MINPCHQLLADSLSIGSAMRSVLEEHQLQSNPGGNDILQAGVDN